MAPDAEGVVRQVFALAGYSHIFTARSGAKGSIVGGVPNAIEPRLTRPVIAWVKECPETAARIRQPGPSGIAAPCIDQANVGMTLADDHIERKDRVPRQSASSCRGVGLESPVVGCVGWAMSRFGKHALLGTPLAAEMKADHGEKHRA